MVFGCWHKRCSFPITVRGKLRRSTAAASVTGTYVVCLDCGREFPYDWSQMKTLASKPRTAWAAQRPPPSFLVSRWLETGAGRFAEPQPPHPVRRTVLLFPERETEASLPN
jgi:hypothetical protein